MSRKGEVAATCLVSFDLPRLPKFLLPEMADILERFELQLSSRHSNLVAFIARRIYCFLTTRKVRCVDSSTNLPTRAKSRRLWQ